MTTSSKQADVHSDAPDRGPESQESDHPDSPALGLLAADRLVVTTLSVAILVLIVAHLARMWWRGTPAIEIKRLPAHELTFQIDINQATWVEWMQLPEIGEVLARTIVEDREQNGPFESIDAVDRVRGIGPVKMQKIRPYLKLGTSLNTAE